MKTKESTQAVVIDPTTEVYTDREINEIAEWAQDLTLKQLFFLKESYESFLKIEAHANGGNGYVH